MPELRRDSITGRWIIISGEDGSDLSQFEIEKHQIKGGFCPFCYGNEDKTPPEIHALREGGGPPNTPGWSTRIIPNKFPALKIEGNLDKVGIGIYDMMNGIGAHEVIIETPEHDKNISDLDDHQVEKIIWAYRDRSLDLRGDKRLKYILLFKNYGRSAGASLEHPHTQLIALPVVPKRVNEELGGSEEYYSYRERCVFCDIIRQELRDNERTVTENEEFLAFCPFASRFPFEIWILPKKHCADFSHIEKNEVINLARILRQVIGRIKNGLTDPAYNYLVHTSPIEAKEREDYHWHIEIMPRLTRVAGFEWGTGFYINPVLPEEAAKTLRLAKG